MKVIEIVEAGLAAKGFNALVVPGVCGCYSGELSPGDCLSDSCEAAYKHTHSQRPQDWIAHTWKEGVTDKMIDDCIAQCG